METTKKTCRAEAVSDVYWDGAGSKSGFPRLVQTDGEVVPDPKPLMQV